MLKWAFMLFCTKRNNFLLNSCKKLFLHVHITCTWFILKLTLSHLQVEGLIRPSLRSVKKTRKRKRSTRRRGGAGNSNHGYKEALPVETETLPAETEALPTETGKTREVEEMNDFYKEADDFKTQILEQLCKSRASRLELSHSVDNWIETGKLKYIAQVDGLNDGRAVEAFQQSFWPFGIWPKYLLLSITCDLLSQILRLLY